jgi:AcrR family transcriptional regulator
VFNHRSIHSKKSATQDQGRAEILSAAEEVFAEVGYQAATVRRICHLAGKNIALVKYHFGDKAGLYTEVLKRVLEEMRVSKVSSALESSGPPEEVLRAAIRARIRGVLRKDLAGRHLRIVAQELSQPTSLVQPLIKQISQPFFEKLLKLVAAIAGLSPRDSTTQLCANSIVGQITLYISHKEYVAQLWPDLKWTAKQADVIADHIADFSLAYLEGCRLKSKSNPATASRKRKSTETRRTR